MSDDLHPVGVRNLVVAITQQGVEDVMLGDPMAIEWLHSRAFDHWCAWLNIDPNAARQHIDARIPKQTRFSREKLDRVLDLHRHGTAWEQSIIDVFGYFSQTLRMRVLDYANQEYSHVR